MAALSCQSPICQPLAFGRPQRGDHALPICHLLMASPERELVAVAVEVLLAHMVESAINASL